MRITGLKCAVIGDNPVVRVVTDEGLSGFAQVESYKPYLRWHVLHYERFILGEDPTDVERVMLRIRRRGASKPWGSAVSAVEIALWDLAGKAAGLPVYKLLGGKVRDLVRVYNGAVRFPMNGLAPEDYAENTARMAASAEGFTIVKQGVAFHSQVPRSMPGFFYGDPVTGGHGDYGYGPITEEGMRYLVECVSAMKGALPAGVGLALDCGPGWTVPDALRFARAVEEHHLVWLEDMLAGDYTPFAGADLYAQVTGRTATPVHTGEQIYLRHGFKELIERRAVDIIGPDPCDVGGLAELKWVAEHAHLHGIGVAPHGTGDGVLGLAALVQVCATLPQNFIAFEYPVGSPSWWYDIVEGLPSPIVRDGFIEVWDRPGLGVEIVPEAARPYLAPEDRDFFD